MAYKFFKNSGTYFRWTPKNLWANQFAGSFVYVTSIWFRVDAVDVGLNLNRLLSWAIGNGSTGFAAGVDSDGSVYAGARSSIADAFTKVTSNRKVSIGGPEWNHLLVMVQYGNPGNIQLFLNGEWDTSLENIAFAASTITPTAQINTFDFLGNGAGNNAAPTSTTEKFAGDIAELTAWGTAGASTSSISYWARKAREIWLKKSGVFVVPDSVRIYPMLRMQFGFTSVGGLVGRQSSVDPFATPVISGSVTTVATHPPVKEGIHWRYRGRKSLILPVGGGAIVNGNLGTTTATGFTAGVDANRTIAGALGTVTATGFQATVANNQVVAGNLGTATATGFQAGVNANTTIAGALGTVAATGFQATVANSTDTTINANLGTATVTGFQATVANNRTIAGALGTVVATGFQATVANSTDTTINANLGTAQAIGYQAFVNANTTINANLGTVTAIGYQASVVSSGSPTYVSNAELYLDIGSGLSMRLGGPRMPFWNTAGRPVAPLDGIYGYNTTTGAIEVWDGSAWV